MPVQPLRLQLARQLRWLRNSCAAFDAGMEDEAVRMAVVMRVLLHDKGRSSSLLGQLDIPNLKLYSTCPLIGPNQIWSTGNLSWFALQAGGPDGPRAINQPILDGHRGVGVGEIPWRDWWTQVVYREGSLMITREQIALTAADKDGGAHVDKALTPEYEQLISGFFSGSVESAEGTTTVQADNLHLSDLRQMAHELSISKDLLAVL